MVKIERVEVSASDAGAEASALVDGERVWFRFPAGVPLTPRAELFLPLALAEAMVRGEDVQVDEAYPISTRLAAGIPEIVNVFCAWNRDDNHQVRVHARTEPAARQWEAVTCCFSGGIDSSFSFARHRAEVTHLLAVMGFDGSTAGQEWEGLTRRLEAFAAAQGKQLIAVETNMRQVFDARKLSWEAAHGSVLACIGIAMQGRALIIPSSYDYSNLFPWGSHPLLDPHWSTEAVNVLHDGIAFTRTQKTGGLMAYPDLLDSIQVCWKHVDRNCGGCSKCVRTSLALQMLGGSAASLPAFVPESISVLRPSSLTGLPFIDDLVYLARAKGRADIADTLVRFRGRFLFKHHLVEAVRALLGLRVQRLAKRHLNKSWHSARTKIKGGTPF